ncbi:hypothetical protein MMC13_003675 [Lambiella insularis]|nr:hypothetical protein [Lambiella insularis]
MPRPCTPVQTHELGCAKEEFRGDPQLAMILMVAGVGWQVGSLGIFALLCAEFGWRVYRAPESQRNSNFTMLRNTFRFKAFMWSLGLATLAIFVRSVFRCAELQGGFHGKLAQQQITFMILEGAMIVSAVLLLTIFHPGLSFQGRWNDASWTLGKKSDAEPKDNAEVVQKLSGDRKWTSWMPHKKSNNAQLNEKAVDVEQASK